jgi:hypothetical protein
MVCCITAHASAAAVDADGKPGAAVRKYVHEVRLQEHLDNMRATQQQLSPEGAQTAVACRWHLTSCHHQLALWSRRPLSNAHIALTAVPIAAVVLLQARTGNGRHSCRKRRLPGGQGTALLRRASHSRTIPACPSLSRGSTYLTSCEMGVLAAGRRQKQRYVDGFKRRHLGAGRQPGAAAAARPAAPPPTTLRPILKVGSPCGMCACRWPCG